MRDKLIELIDDNKACPFDDLECSECEYYDITPCFAGRMADALIAHGVTFAEDNNVPTKPMTNGDKIRAMSDEELSFFLWIFNAEAYSLEETCGDVGICTQRKLKEWLEAEAAHDPN